MGRATKRDNFKPSFNVSNIFDKRIQEGICILLFGISIFLFVSLITYNSEDAAWSTTGSSESIKNATGYVGAVFSDLYFYFFGYLSYSFPFMIGYFAVLVFQKRFATMKSTPDVWFLRVLGFTLTVIAGCGLATMYFASSFEVLPETSGGILGAFVFSTLVVSLNYIGTSLLLSALFLAGITLSTGLSWYVVIEYVGKGILFLSRRSFVVSKIGSVKIFNSLVEFVENVTEIARTRREQSTSSKRTFVSRIIPRFITSFVISTLLMILPKFIRNMFLAKPASSSNKLEVYDEDDEYAEFESFEYDTAQFTKSQPIKVHRPETNFYQSTNEQEIKQTKKPLLKKIRPVFKKEHQGNMFARGTGELPEVSLLDMPVSSDKSASYSESQLENLSREVEAKLLDFGVDAKVVSVYPGPVITRFELELAPGIKVSKLSGLAKDLARELTVTKVRVVEVIPGRSVVGIEIPNKHRETVKLREILESSAYENSESPLTLALGKDISGNPMVVDLAKMPHLLVAGTTGSGKSVGINAMLLSLLYKSTPEQIRLILIDPKMLELSIYDGIPHLLTPVVTDMKDAANSLRWCVAEMERRYQLMAAMGVRNIIGFNRKIQAAIDEGKPIYDPLWQHIEGEKHPTLEKLPYIVVIIDEFADMIMVVGKKVEELIARIAQKARAAGINMILATQRPSVDVITGLIKANVPSRIAFQVSSRIDSRTILDQQGAEQLLGHGDMLYLPPGTGVPTRVHGAFVSDDEVHKVVGSIKKLGKPDYVEAIYNSSNSSNFSGMSGVDFDGESDELYDEAVSIVTETRKASISYLQRRLKIGYNRSARLIEDMEAAGIVSPMQSNGTREVIAPPPPK